MVAAEGKSSMTADLAGRVQQHLGDEERTLIAVLESVRALHQTLRELDGESLAQALQNEMDALRVAEGIQKQRKRIRAEAASELGVSPQELTLGRLAQNTTGDVRSSIVESREKLATMASEMDRLNRQNAAMIQQSLLLMRGIVGRLTGTAAPGESYNAGGGREEAHVGSIIQWGG